MHREAPKLLEDIRDAGTFVLQVVAERDQQEYEGDRLARQAVERNLEIIGEAVNRLSRLDAQTGHRVGPVPRIIAFRNILVHAYDNIDHGIVWHVVQDELPRLVAAVESLMREARFGRNGPAPG